MARRSAKAARRKDAKRQRAVDKRAERARNRSLCPDNPSPAAAAHRMQLLHHAVAKGETPAPRGLVNLGNTCFFNAVIQNLARIASLRDYFVGTAPCPGEGPTTTALRSFFVAAWDINNPSVFDPSALFAAVEKQNPSFRGRAQQDAHELMRVLFDAFIEEEKKRLADVARGKLPAAPESDKSDTSSETEAPIATTDGHTLNHPLTTINAQPQPGPFTVSGTAAIILPEPSCTCTADSEPSATSAIETKSSQESSEEEVTEEEEIPSDKLTSIVEETMGGVLSSTITCCDCGTMSSVVEPFLDLQLPLIPREKPMPKAATKTSGDVTEVAEASSKSAGNARELVHVKPESSMACNDEKKNSSSKPAPPAKPISCAPPAPPPPPPPPLPSTFVRSRNSDATLCSANTDCDVMRQLRETVARADQSREPEPENKTAVSNSVAPAQSSAQQNVTFDEDDDSEGCSLLFSLFEDDDEDNIESHTDEINDLNAFSTSAAAAASSAPSSSEVKPKEPSPSPSPAKRTSFISSLFGGLGGASAAPHGYRSVVGSLEEFTKKEILEGDNAYGCDECTRRELLRIALLRRDKRQFVGKKMPIVSQQLDEECGEEKRSQDDEIQVGSDCREKSRTVTEDHDQSKATPNMETSTSEGSQTPILMSSPVTSSESSSGVSSEDDGELVIEEELEDRSMAANGVCALTREEEDELVKQVDVKIPCVRTTAEKRFLIREAPNVLSIQLNRFTQVGYRGGLRKISGHVEFPLTLDMTAFMETIAQSTSIEVEHCKRPDVAKRKRKTIGNTERKDNYEYLLTGVVVHGGSLSGGHYISYVRESVEPHSRGGWYLCNDSKISRASEKDVLRSDAYLCYYERINT